MEGPATAQVIGSAGGRDGTPLMLAMSRAAFLLMLLSLPFLKHALLVGGLPVVAADGLFLVSAGALALAIARGHSRLRWDPLHAFLLIYFLAMVLSATTAADPGRSLLKLASQAYLLLLPLLAATLVEGRDDLRRAALAWLAATAVASAIGALTVLLYFLGVERPLAGYALHEFGTLPPGPYPRLEATFDYPAMLCNYLTVSLLILLAARRMRWIGRSAFSALLAALLVTAVFTLTPGLGGIFLALGLWLWLAVGGLVGRLAMAAGVLAAIAFVAAASVTPFLHPTAPFLFDLGGGRLVSPSVRMLAWIDSAETFAANPILGTGIGTDPAFVRYVAPSGNSHVLTDAHNMFLNIAAQCGILGLSALLLLVGAVVARMRSWRFDSRGTLPLALAAGWLIAFVYEGLTGSYEDARHLWILLGLVIASDRLSRSAAEPSTNRISPLAKNGKQDDAGGFEERESAF